MTRQFAVPVCMALFSLTLLLVNFFGSQDAINLLGSLLQSAKLALSLIVESPQVIQKDLKFEIEPRQLQSLDDFSVRQAKNSGSPTFSTSLFHSTVHCVGENFGSNAWMYRSCRFRNLCYDIKAGDFVVFPSPQEIKLQELLWNNQELQKTVTISTLSSFNTSSMAIGPQRITEGLTSCLENCQKQRLQWFPRVVTSNKVLSTQGYYELPSDVILMPFQPTILDRLIWKDTYSLFLVLELFGLSESNTFLPIRHCPIAIGGEFTVSKCKSFSSENGLDAFSSAVFRSKEGKWPKREREPIITMDELVNQVKEIFSEGETSDTKTPFICARDAVAGIGMLSSPGNNGVKELTDEVTQAYSNQQYRIALRTEFTRFLRRNLNLNPDESRRQRQKELDPLKVTFAIYQSKSSDFLELSRLVQQLLKSSKMMKDDTDVVVELSMMDDLSLQRQAEIAADSSIFITEYGLSSEQVATASFLSQDSSLLVSCHGCFNDAEGKINFSASSSLDAAEDWSLWAIGPTPLRVHWLSFQQDDNDSRNTFLNALVDRIVQEVGFIKRQRSFRHHSP